MKPTHFKFTERQILDKFDRKNFDHLESFPGNEDNPFDVALVELNRLNNLSGFIIFIFVFLISGLATAFSLKNWLILMAFSISDYLIISFLPFFKISFGRTNSQALLLFILRIPFIWLPYPWNLLTQLVGTLLVLAGFYYEPSMIKLTRLEVFKEGLEKPFKFIHLSDLHLEKFGVREKKILQLVKQLRPQFIVFTGDFLNLSYLNDQKAIDDVIIFFNQINQVSPVYFVTGSPAVDIESTVDIIEKGVQANHLKNKSIQIGTPSSVNLIGLDCTHQPHLDIRNLENLPVKNMLNILLYHSPDLIYELTKEYDIDIMLSGHTHGGQVRLPFFGAIFTGSLYGRKLQKGLCKYENILLYISRGIGLEGLGAPRIRFLCPPELILWQINN